MSAASLGLMLHVRRKALKLRQVPVAQRIGMSQSALSKIEHGTIAPGLAEAHTLEEILGIPMWKMALELKRVPTPQEFKMINAYWKSPAQSKREFREGRNDG